MHMSEEERTARGGRHGRPGGENRGGDLLEEFFAGAPDAQLLFVGSLNCLRHKPYLRIGQYMREGRASVLCPSMADLSTGRYLRQVVDAIVELSRERGSRNFILSFGCQWVILSTDSEMIQQELRDNYQIELTVFDDSHLEYGDHE